MGLSFYLFGFAQHAADTFVAEANAAKFKMRKIQARRTPKEAVPVPNQYIVTFKRSVTDPKAEADRLAQTVSGTVLQVYNTVFMGCGLRVQPGNQDLLKTDAAVARVEQDVYMYTCTIAPTGIRRIQFANAPRTPPFQLLFPGQPPPPPPPSSSNGGGPINIPPGSIKPPSNGFTAVIKPIAVIDSGIDSTHPDLNVVLSKGFGQPDGTDANGHGTHVSGIIAAKPDAKGVQGVLPGAPLWALRVFDSSGTGTTTDVIAACDFVAQNATQTNVCNMSLGGGFSQSLNDAVDACVDRGVVMCVAAGNSSDDAGGHSPASAPKCICVAALADSDGLPGGRGPKLSDGDPDDTFASFSSFGSVVKVIAPGVDILSTWPVAKGSYQTESGTSMATPHVAGMSALYIVNAIGTPIPPSTGGGSISSPPINIPPGSGPGGSTGGSPGNGVGTGTPPTPGQVLTFLLTESVENIPGLSTNKDKRTYPLITGRP
jgi:subtilisin family serine protease